MSAYGSGLERRSLSAPSPLPCSPCLESTGKRLLRMGSALPKNPRNPVSGFLVLRCAHGRANGADGTRFLEHQHHAFAQEQMTVDAILACIASH